MPAIRFPMLKNTANAYSYGGQNILFEEAPGFLIRSVEINNQSGKWVYLPVLGVYCPPYQSGIALTPGGALAMKAILQSPPALPDIGGDGNVYIYLYDEVIAGASTLTGSPTTVQATTGNTYSGLNWPMYDMRGLVAGSDGGELLTTEVLANGTAHYPFITLDAGSYAKYKVTKIYINHPFTATAWQLWRTTGGAFGGIPQVPVSGNPAIPAFVGDIRTMAAGPYVKSPVGGSFVTGVISPFNFSYPTVTGGIIANDLLVWGVVSNQPASVITPPAGWILAGSIAITTTTTGRFYWFYRIATGGETGNTGNWTITNGGTITYLNFPTLFRPPSAGTWSVGQSALPVDNSVATTESFSVSDSSGKAFISFILGGSSANAVSFSPIGNAGANIYESSGGTGPSLGILGWSGGYPNQSFPTPITATATAHSIGYLNFLFTPSMTGYLWTTAFALLATTPSIAQNVTTAIDVTGVVGSDTFVTPGQGLMATPVTMSNTAPNANNLLGAEVVV